MKTRSPLLLMVMFLATHFAVGQTSTSPADDLAAIVQALRSGDSQAAEKAFNCNPREYGFMTCAAARGIAYGVKKDLQKAVAELQLTELDRYWNKEYAFENKQKAVFYPLIEQHVKPYYDYLEGNWSYENRKLSAQKFKSAVASVPQFDKAWHRLSEIQLSEMNYTAALASINKAVLYGPADRGYLIHRVKIYMSIGDGPSRANALVDVKEAIAKDKNYGYLGMLYLVELDAPQEIPTVRDLREHCAAKPNVDAGIFCYGQAIKYGPQSPPANFSVPYWYMYTDRARLFEKKERWSEAAADFLKYVEIATQKRDPDGRTIQYAIDAAARNSARAKAK